MKILHCADIHLGKRPFGNENFSSKRYEDYFNSFADLVFKAIEKKVDIFLIVGDLFDKRELTPDNLKRAEVILKELKKNSIETLIIEGNHDNFNRYDEVNSWLHYLEIKKLAKRLTYKREKETYSFIPYKIEDINFFGLGYPGFNVDRVITELSSILNENEKNIILIHTALGGGDSSSLPGLVKTETLNQLKDKAIYVAGGHFHSKSTYPKENPFFFIPGSTEYWNIVSERSDEKGAFIFDTESRDYEFIRVKTRKRIKVNYEIVDKIEDENSKFSYYEEFKTFIKSLNLTGEELVIVNLLIKNSSYINSNELEEILEDQGALKAYVIPKFNKNRLDSKPLEDEKSNLEEIEREIINSWEGFGKADINSYLNDLKEYQVSEKSVDNFFDIFDSMLDEVLENDN